MRIDVRIVGRIDEAGNILYLNVTNGGCDCCCDGEAVVADQMIRFDHNRPHVALKEIAKELSWVASILAPPEEE